MELNFEKMPRFAKDSIKIWGLIPQWRHAYQVDQDAIISQLYTAHTWCDSNPTKAPKKLITRFLSSWMAAAKRYGNLKTKETQVSKVPEVLPQEDMSYEEMVRIREQNMKRGHA